MIARAVVLFTLLPTLCAAEQGGIAPATHDWLPESAVVELPGESPVTVSFLVDSRLGQREEGFSSYLALLLAARGGDSAAAYSLYEYSHLCDMFRRMAERGQLAVQRAAEADPRRAATLRLCDTMPGGTEIGASHWLRVAAEAGHPQAILKWGQSGIGASRAEKRAALERLWYRGYVPALGVLAVEERRWRTDSGETARTLFVRSVAYEWLYARLTAAAYASRPEYHKQLEQIARGLDARWASLNEMEQKAVLLHARSLLLESPGCCTVSATAPSLHF